MNPYLYPGLEFGPVIIERLLGRLTAEQIDGKSDPNRFTAREAIAHLADWEPILRGRMMRAIEAPDSDVFGIDEGSRAIERRYHELAVEEQIALFKAERGTTISWLKSLPQEDWEKAVVHNEKGRMTIAEQASMLLGHDLYHIEHLTQFLVSG